MLVIQKTPRTADVPLLQYSDTTVDVAEKTPQEQHQDFVIIQMDKERRSAYLRTENKKPNVFDSGSRTDLSFAVQEDTEVIHGRRQRRNEDQL